MVIGLNPPRRQRILPVAGRWHNNSLEFHRLISVGLEVARPMDRPSSLSLTELNQIVLVKADETVLSFSKTMKNGQIRIIPLCSCRHKKTLRLEVRQCVTGVHNKNYSLNKWELYLEESIVLPYGHLLKFRPAIITTCSQADRDWIVET